jgi:hypothetical protein
MNDIYYADNFEAFVKDIHPNYDKTLYKEQRIIFPFYDEKKTLLGFQGRAIGESKIKYITIKLDDDNKKVFGLDRVDFSKKIYVVEGPIDSLFLPNAVAVSGASFDTPTIRQLLTNATIIMDNEPRNKDIVKQLEKYIESGFSVCMFPNSIQQKDINEMILHGEMTADEITEVINTNTHTGMEAKLRFSEWRVK